MNQKVLICGNRSFVATGLYEKMSEAGCQVECFSRGKAEKKGDQITGKVDEISNNPFLASQYDVVINFIVIMDGTIEDNLKYIKDLVRLCRNKSVKRLVHISSIMVYNNNETVVDEKTEVEQDTDKSGYGAVKIEVDRYLQLMKKCRFKISLVRPGYVLAEDRTIPYVKKLPFRCALIKGNRNSIKPIVQRNDLQKGLVKIIGMNLDDSVFLFIPSTNITKLQYAKKANNRYYLFMPKWLFLGVAKLFVSIGLISKPFYVRVEGMYMETQYDSSLTERLLKIKF